MVSNLSPEMISGAVELICVVSTAMVAFMSYLLTMRF